MAYRCSACRIAHDSPRDCPMLSTISLRVAEPPVLDAADALAARMLEYRTALKAHLGYAQERGWVFPEIIRTTDPDYTQP